MSRYYSFYLAGISQIISDKVFITFGFAPLSHNIAVSSYGELAQALWAVRVPWLVSNGIVIGLMGLFIVACQMAYGTTPGKWLLGLKIVRHETLEPVAHWRYAVRFLAYIPAAAPLMLGIFWMLFNKKRRGWHDYMAGTVVIHTRPKGWYWQQVKRGYRWVRGALKQS